MATIGVDLTPLQGPHRMRGVGATAMNVLKHLSEVDCKNHTFVLFLYDQGRDEALELIDASRLKNYTVRTVKEMPEELPSIKTLRGLLQLPRRIMRSFYDNRHGTRRISDVGDLDIFLQFEQDIIPPRDVKSIVVTYDLIPYILESNYLWNYSTARHTHHYSRRGAMLVHVRRQRYIRTIRTVAKRAHKLIAISEQTKKDFIKYAQVVPDKLDVVYLGASDTKVIKHPKPSPINRYVGTSWGDVKVEAELPKTPFLLFVGGADPRRKLADLIHSFNQLRAQGHDMHLVLAGDTMLGPNSIPNDEARRALLSSSYLNDIYLLGFVDDATREWLYQNALAFVYPSTYEGYGLPILEAMRYGTPVITYKNSSIAEVAATYALYASDWIEITEHTMRLLNDEAFKSNIRDSSIKHSESMTWTQTADNIISLCTKNAQTT